MRSCDSSISVFPRASRLLMLGLVVVFSTLALVPAAQAKAVLLKEGGEQQINLLATGNQTAPAIAADAQGNYAVAWLGPDELFRPHLFVRLFDASGNPRTGDLLVDEEVPAFEEPKRPRVAMAPDGRFIVLWSGYHAWARLYDAQGHALGGRIRTDDVPLWSGTAADLTIRPDGSFVVTWLGVATSYGIYARSFDAQGQPTEAARKLDVERTASQLGEPRILTLASGDSLVVWLRQQSPNLFQHDSQMIAARRPVAGGPWSAEIELFAFRGVNISGVAPVALPGGGFSLVWVHVGDYFPPSFADPKLFARRFEADGTPATPLRLLSFSSYFEGPPAAAADRNGNTFVIVPFNYQQRTEGRLFDDDWNQVGDSAKVATFEEDFQLEPVVTLAGEGFVAAWSSGSYPPVFFPSPPYGQDGYGFGIFAQRFGPPPCAEGSKVLCLGADGRFELSVDWKTPLGTEGEGRVHRLTSDSGAFWFFQPSNLELLTKVLDGRPVNGHFWVFSGALSNVDYTLTVRDSQTGESRSYHNPQGTLASRADIEAFLPGDPEPAPAPLAEGASVSFKANACGEEHPSALCLAVSRPFEITVDFVDPRTGMYGAAKAVPLTANTGAFTFFDDANLELVVKILDGGPVNGKIWVFYGALSDVEYMISVQDVQTGLVRTYANVHGRLVSRADTSAFEAGPALP